MALSKLDSTALGTLSGDIVFADGQGIDFSATSDGSGTMSSELLDDYEEGTFTPVFRGNTTAGTVTGNTYGRYTKIGNCVHFVIRTQPIGVSGASGTFRIGGFPYNIKVTNSMAAVAIPHALYNVTFDGARIQSWYGVNNTDYVLGLESRGGTTWLDWSITNGTNQYINIAGHYYTN